MSILTPAQLQRVRKFQTGGDASNYISAVQQNTQQMDPITQQLLFGLDGQGGFIPGAFRAAERTFLTTKVAQLLFRRRLQAYPLIRFALKSLLVQMLELNSRSSHRLWKEASKVLMRYKPVLLVKI